MPFPSDLEIARKAMLKPLDDIAGEIGIGPNLLEPYGEWAGIASVYLLAGFGRGLLPVSEARAA